MPTTLIDPKTLSAKFVDAFNSHDESAIKSLTAPNATLTAPGDVRLSGRDAVAGYAINWLKAFPDARFTVRHEIVSGPWIIDEYTFEGTHRASLSGPLGVIPATNKRMVGHGVQISRWEDDKLVNVRLYFDMVEVLTQIGMMPVPVKA
jgi:predicted ester cyclase